jgi:tetratricopeptide (TPR) repeat protein
VRRERKSSVAGEVEYAFRHLLVRDVAYGQLPRAVRAEKHRLAARWIESLGRPEDHAEMLAHHYLSALELAHAVGEPTDELAGAAYPVLRDAGHRAFSLNSFQAAVRFYDEALALASPEDEARADLQFRRARALQLAGGSDSEEALEEARGALSAVGDLARAAEADAILAELWWHRGERDRAFEHLDRALALVEDLPASPGKAHVLSQVARYRALAESDEDAIRIGREALAMAESLGLVEVQAHALNNIAVAKEHLGDPTSVPDLERSIEIALAARSPEVARGYNNLAAFYWTFGDFRRACALMDEAVSAGERLGNASIAVYARALQTFQLFPRGDWDEGFRRADEFLAALESGGSHYSESDIRRVRARARLARDDVAGALDDVAKLLPAARRAGDPQVLVPALAWTARIYSEVGEPARARPYADEALAVASREVWVFDALAWYAEELDCVSSIAERIENQQRTTRWTDAARAILEKNFAGAADVYFEIGDLLEEAFARLRSAEQLAAEGRRAEADEQLQRSLAFWRSVGATRYVRQGEALLAAAS